MKRSRVNLILLSITALLFVIILNDLGNEARQQEAARVSELTANSIFRIRIESADQKPVVMILKGEDWHMLEPQQGMVDKGKVNTLLSLPASISVEPLRREEIDAVQLKLEPPRASLILGQDHNKQRFDFGDHNPLNNRRYVASGEWVHQLVDRHYHLLKASVDSWLLPPEETGETETGTP